MKSYVIGSKENKRGGQSKAVSNLVKRHGPISSSEICDRLKSIPRDNTLWHISQLFRSGFLKAVKAEKPQSKMLTKKQAEKKAKQTSKLNGGRKFKAVKVTNVATGEEGFDVTPVQEAK